MVIEGCQPEISFSIGTKSGTRRTDNTGIFQQVVKKFPALHPIRALHPDIRGILATGVMDSQPVKGICKNAGIFPVIIDIGKRLAASFFRKDGCCAFLDDVGDTIEFGGLTSEPESIQCHTAAYQCIRNNGIAAAGTGKSCRLGEGAEFDGDLFCTLYLIDGAGQRRICDKALICGIKENNRIPFFGVVYPCFQSCMIVYCTGRVIGGADIDDICVGVLIRQRQKSIGSIGISKHNLASGHDIGVDINRIYRVGNQNRIVCVKQVEDIAEIGFCAVADKNFIKRKGNTLFSIVSGNFFFQEIISLFRAIAVKGFLDAHFSAGALQRFHNCRTKRKGYITDAQSDNIHFRVLLLKLCDLFADHGKKIALFKLQIMLIDFHLVVLLEVYNYSL